MSESSSDNKLNKSQMALIKLIEECSELSVELMEVSKRATKALRFGPDEVQPGQDKNNMERLKASMAGVLTEYRDLLAAISEVHPETAWLMNSTMHSSELAERIGRIRKYEQLSKNLGIMEQ